MTIAELLEAVRRVEVRTNRLVNDMMVGAYLSQFKGRGMDFEELREYIPGDEVRDIDWNVTYRMGRPFVKRFREERELAMVLPSIFPLPRASAPCAGPSASLRRKSPAPWPFRPLAAATRLPSCSSRIESSYFCHREKDANTSFV